ncbi:hypothetical protein AB0K62_13785 [Streptomyces halstedii]|uniref:hypothetical protein n=1 Tax=Streptomyces halstedii TaxID=1944 RepID=UPI003460A62B
MPRTTMVAVRLPGGRLLIASLDPTTPDHHSPLRHHFRAHANSSPQEPGEDQPGQTPIHAPR